MNKASKVGLILLLIAVIISITGILQPLFMSLFAIAGIFLLIYGLIS